MSSRVPSSGIGVAVPGEKTAQIYHLVITALQDPTGLCIAYSVALMTSDIRYMATCLSKSPMPPGQSISIRHKQSNGKTIMIPPIVSSRSDA